MAGSPFQSNNNNLGFQVVVFFPKAAQRIIMSTMSELNLSSPSVNSRQALSDSVEG